MTPIKRRLTYVFKGTLLRLFVSWENRKKSVTISTGYNIDKVDAKGKSKWNGSRCATKSYHGKDRIPGATINKALENLEEEVDKIFYYFEMKNKIPSTEEFKERLKSPNKIKMLPFIKTYNDFIIDGVKKISGRKTQLKA